MKSLWILLVVAACNAADGTRAVCGEGGALTQPCPDVPRTAEGACRRLVDCGAILLDAANVNRLDWGACVGGNNRYRGLERLPSDRRRVAIDCILASSCDQLKVDRSPDDPQPDQMTCLLLGGL